MSTFQDPFAGTPKAATRREYGVDNVTPLEKARRGIIFEENGLFGMKDIDGTELYPAVMSSFLNRMALIKNSALDVLRAAICRKRKGPM